MTDAIPDSHAFVVVLWHEGRDIAGTAPVARCSARPLAGGETRYFDTFDALARFLSEMSDGFPVGPMRGAGK